MVIHTNVVHLNGTWVSCGLTKVRIPVVTRDCSVVFLWYAL